MVAQLRAVPVDELAQEDWQGVLRLLATLLGELAPLARSGSATTYVRPVLAAGLHRARRDQLPVGPEYPSGGELS